MIGHACSVCRRPFSTLFRTPPNHLGSKNCLADAAALQLFDLGLVPYPTGNTLPGWFPKWITVTRAMVELRFVGHVDREASLSPQQWAPLWVRVLTETTSQLLDGALKNGPAAREYIRVRDARIERGLHDAAFAQSVEVGWRLGGERAVWRLLELEPVRAGYLGGL